jgi:inner membrane protein
MYAPGHVGIALFAYTPIAYRLERAGRWQTWSLGAAVIAFIGVWPDVDSAIGLVHRGPTHTLWAALLAGVVLALLAGTLDPRHTGFGFGVGALGTLCHLAGDVITPMGIRPLEPFFAGDYTLDLVAAADPSANFALLTLGTTVFILGVETARSQERVPRPVERGS